MQDVIDIKVLQPLSPERKPYFFRSAGACPPQSLRRNEKRPQPGGHGRLLLRPGHGEGQALALRLTETVSYFRISIFRVALKSPAVSV